MIWRMGIENIGSSLHFLVCSEREGQTRLVDYWGRMTKSGGMEEKMIRMVSTGVFTKIDTRGGCWKLEYILGW